MLYGRNLNIVVEAVSSAPALYHVVFDYCEGWLGNHYEEGKEPHIEIVQVHPLYDGVVYPGTGVYHLVSGEEENHIIDVLYAMLEDEA